MAASDSISTKALELGPLMEPAPVEFTFETPGWYVVFTVLVLLTGFAFWKWLQFYRKNAYRRAALKNLETIKIQYAKTNDSQCVNDVAVLLKLVAIHAYGREKVAPLYEESWLTFLESKSKNANFKKYQDTFNEVIYLNKEAPAQAVNELILETKKWISAHVS